ncbi:MAG: glycosyltransferase, partial [Gammaproteobacteria bacterium]|nr:glycosyltransferase [Gammaproteobacteria bacterium]
LHNGIGIHFRSLDCMASGGVIVYRSTSRDNHHEGINSHFEPFRHYIPLNDDYEKVRFYLNNPNKRYKISKEASELVKQKHTWAKRCEKITQDLKRL